MSAAGPATMRVHPGAGSAGVFQVEREMKAKILLMAQCKAAHGKGHYVAQFDANIEWIPLNAGDGPFNEVPFEILEICIADEMRTLRQVWPEGTSAEVYEVYYAHSGVE